MVAIKLLLDMPWVTRLAFAVILANVVVAAGAPL